MTTRYGLLSMLLLGLATQPARAQCLSATDTIEVLPHAYTVPEGGTAIVSVNTPPQAGVNYVLYRDGVNTDQVLSGNTADSLHWSVDEPGVYRVVAQQGSCEETVDGQCLVSHRASVESCACGGPSVQPATLDLCGRSSVTIAVQGGLVLGFYSLLRDGNPIRQMNVSDCNQPVILWDDITDTGIYTVQGPSGCAVTGQTEVVRTDDCNDDCGTAAAINLPSTAQPPTNLCQGDITLTASKDRSSYAWYYVAPDGDSQDLGTPFAQSKSVTIDASGTYYLRTTDDCGALQTSSVPITMKPAMSGVSLSGPTAVARATTQYTARGYNVNAFTWDVSGLGEGHTVSYSSEQLDRELVATATVTWASGFTGEAVLRATASGCEGTTEEQKLPIVVGVGAGPDLTVNHRSAPVRLSGATPPGGRWSVSPDAAAEALSDSYFYPAHPSVSPGTYTLTYTLPGGGASDTRTITVQSLPNNYNYVTQEVFRTGSATPATMSSLAVDDRSQHYTYIDGQGRTMQEVQWQGSPGQQSMRQSTEYDALSRPAQQFLPYVAGNTVNYQANGTAAFYNNPPNGVSGDSKPYARTDYEASPLSRPLSTTGPGHAWHQANKKTSYQYRVAAGGSVYRLSVGTGPDDVPVSSGPYGAGELVLNEATDEDGRTSRSYTNKSGETVLREVQDDNGWLATYYVYDDYGNLRYVLPPKAVAQIGGTFSGTAYRNTLQQLAFRYVYDERQRMIYRRVPGTAAATQMLYDERDRLVLSQNARQAELGQWSFVKYDVLNRPIMTGVYASGSSRSALQAAIDAEGWSESRVTSGTIGYTLSGSFPNVSAADVRTVTYYDDYRFTDDAYSGDKIALPRGQTTGSRTRVLRTDRWLTTVVYYDHRYRVVHTASENHRGGTDRVTHTYDFVGNLLTRTHQHSNSSLTLRETYTYDHADRLLAVTHRTNDGGTVTVAEYEYNALGEVIEKNLHRRGSEPFAQSVDYRYNIRGWLRNINRSDLQNDATLNPDTGQQPADLFGLDLLYHRNTANLDE